MQTDFSRPILAMDTSTAYLSLAIFVNEKMYEYHELVGNKHSNLILPKIGELLAKAQISVADLGAIVYVRTLWLRCCLKMFAFWRRLMREWAKFSTHFSIPKRTKD